MSHLVFLSFLRVCVLRVNPNRARVNVPLCATHLVPRSCLDWDGTEAACPLHITTIACLLLYAGKAAHLSGRLCAGVNAQRFLRCVTISLAYCETCFCSFQLGL
uniref:Putative secreted protein n=1 Tax=Ixodes ricinus TaxID=34613 RepID=A0A6B0U818_IXORI